MIYANFPLQINYYFVQPRYLPKISIRIQEKRGCYPKTSCKGICKSLKMNEVIRSSAV